MNKRKYTAVPLKAEKGFTLIAMAVTIVCLIAMLALSFDLGRAYLAKNETQTFTDSASLEATLELDGTFAGISRAQSKVASNDNRWNFGHDAFRTVSVTFARDKAGPWES